MLAKKDLDHLLMTMLRAHQGASDLNFTPGRPLQVEASGELKSVDFEPPIRKLTPFQTEMLGLSVLGSDRNNLEALVKHGSADCAYGVPGQCRFRVNVFQTRKCYSLVLRKLETNILTIDDLGLPPIFKEMAAVNYGLILVTGATGSGKSTTLAAVLNHMNETRPVHILTIEDPIEFVHPHKKATFNQRELGTDFDTFHSSLRAALRQAPKVILIGEMRDRETVDIGLAAASTGHLVLSTLHSIDCGQTINRIVGMFDKEEEEQIRARLAECLRFVVNQRLLPKKGGGRVGSQEIMGVNMRVHELLVNGESEGKTFYEVIEAGRPRGWQTHDQCIVDSYEKGLISEETALMYASKRPILARMIDRLKQEAGVKEDDELQLNLDTTSKEAGKLLSTYWPKAETQFPKRLEMDQTLAFVIYEPVVALKGGEALLRFPVKTQGEIAGIRSENPRGELEAKAVCRAGEDPQAAFQQVSVLRFEVEGHDVMPKFGGQLATEFPTEMNLPNPRLTEGKKKALVRLAEIGKGPHLLTLSSVLENSQDPEEKAAVSKVMQTIKERL